MTTDNKTPEGDENAEENNENNEPELIDVISAAIDEVTPDDVLEANKETNEIEDGSADAGEQTLEEKAAEEKAAEAEAAQTPEEKAAAETAAAAEAAAAEADDKDDDAEQTPEEKAAAETAAEAEAAKADPINDPIPKSTKAETATRIKALIDIAKGNTARGDQGDEIVAQITATGADPDQYANTLGFLKLYNSKDPAMRKQALAAAEGVVRELRIELGEGTVALLDNHADLRVEVEAGTLTEARAIEVATGREKATLDTARTTAASNKSDSEAQTLENIATGRAQLTTLETTLQASDKDYGRLHPTFVAMLRPALRKAHPTEWGEVAQEIYDAVKAANPEVAKLAKPLPQTPLRPKGSGGAGSTDKTEPPATALDAVNLAMENM